MGVFENALISGDELLKYIPQRSPIVMVDKFFGINGNESYSGLTVGGDNIFCIDGRFQETGLIEHIAQSAALRVGYEHIENEQPVPVGFIGSVNKCSIHKLPSEGAYLQTVITVEMEMMNITLISATVKHGDETVAECQMKICLQKDA